MNAIVCVDSKNMIGKDNDLLVYIPEDLKFFKEKTTGNTIVLGKKTLDSFPNGALLPNREHIILTRDKDTVVDGAVVYNSIDEFLTNVDITRDDIFLCGGGQIYDLLLDYCDTLYITMVDKDFGGTVAFPDYEARGFVKVIEDVELEWDDFTYRHTVWKKKGKK